jgi:holliday junction DNA helicase RuvA
VISRIRGALLLREMDRVEVLTPGGVGYEILIPLSAFERLPALGDEVELFTVQVVREDAVLLFGFAAEVDRTVFNRLLLAPGVGPKLALNMLSAVSAERLVRAIRERNTTALTAVSGVGKKTAERLVLDLAGKLDDIRFAPSLRGGDAPGWDEAVRALGVLGFAAADAEQAVRDAAREDSLTDAQSLIRAALARLR